MLANLPPFVQKLWDKGIDISASLIVTGVTALKSEASRLAGVAIRDYADTEHAKRLARSPGQDRTRADKKTPQS